MSTPPRTGRVSETGTLEELAAGASALVARLLGVGGQATVKYTLPEGERSFAVLDLEPAGVSPEIARNLTQILGVEIKRIEGASVVSRDDLRALLEKERLDQLLGQCDTSCMAELGGMLGVDKLVVGTVGKLNDSFALSLRLIDPRRAVVDNRVTETFRGREDELLRAIRQAARDLLGITPSAKGSLVVSTPQRGVELYVDANLVGELPAPPVTELVPGRHNLRLSGHGYLDWHAEVYVDPGETTAVYAELTDAPERWYQKWWIWTLAGAALAGGGVTVFLATRPPALGSGVVTGL